MKFISDGTWFDKGTEVECLSSWTMGGEQVGLFKGIRTCQSPGAEAREMNEKYIDEELCGFDEFEIIEE